MGSLVSNLLTQENWSSSSTEQFLRISPSGRTGGPPTEKKILLPFRLILPLMLMEVCLDILNLLTYKAYFRKVGHACLMAEKGHILINLGHRT